MYVQVSTASTSLQQLSGAAILLEYVRNAPIIESQVPSYLSGQSVPGFSPTWIDFSNDTASIVRYAEAFESIEPFLDRFRQYVSQSITTMDSARNTGWPTIEDAPRKHLISRQDQILNASNHEGIFRSLRFFGLESVADRLSFLHGLAFDDPSERPIEIDSVRELALFLLKERQFSDPELTISPMGLAQAEWRVGQSGILAMEFQSNGLIRFAAISAPATDGYQRTVVNGTMQKAAAIEAIQVFKEQLASDEGHGSS